MWLMVSGLRSMIVWLHVTESYHGDGSLWQRTVVHVTVDHEADRARQEPEPKVSLRRPVPSDLPSGLLFLPAKAHS